MLTKVGPQLLCVVTDGCREVQSVGDDEEGVAR
jgi:hypothetical protein